MYAEQMDRLLAVFGRRRVLVLQYERCRASFAEEARRTYEFLGLDPDAAQVEEEQPRPERDWGAGWDERRALGGRYLSDVRRLTELVPELDLELWPNLKPLL